MPKAPQLSAFTFDAISDGSTKNDAIDKACQLLITCYLFARGQQACLR